MEFLIIILLILINGIFSMTEIAVVSSRKTKLESLTKKGDIRAKKILETSDSPEKFLSTVQIAITAIGIITGMYSGSSLIEPIKNMFVSLGLHGSVLIWLPQFLILLLITYLTLVLGELLPKKIGMNNPEKIASFVITPMNFITKLTYPFVLILSCSTNFLMKVFRIKKSDSTIITEDEIKAIINESTEVGEIKEVEQDIVERVFSLGDRDIASLMTHRNDFQWIDVNDSFSNIQSQISEHLHYIYPVADKTLDNVIGVVYLKDMFNKGNMENIRQIIKEPQFLPDSASVYHALEIFKENRIHYALVIDEFGVIIGIVTMNDILESLVGSAGELSNNENEYEITEREDGSWLVDGQYPFFDFLRYYDLEEKYQELSYNTLSGLILELIGKIPKVGEKINWEDFYFEIVDMDVARIDKVLVTRM